MRPAPTAKSAAAAALRDLAFQRRKDAYGFRNLAVGTLSGELAAGYAQRAVDLDQAAVDFEAVAGWLDIKH